MHRVPYVLYESCWKLAHSSSGRDVCVTSFFQGFWRQTGSLPDWEGYRILKYILGQLSPVGQSHRYNLIFLDVLNANCFLT